MPIAKYNSKFSLKYTGHEIIYSFLLFNFSIASIKIVSSKFSRFTYLIKISFFSLNEEKIKYFENVHIPPIIQVFKKIIF